MSHLDDLYKESGIRDTAPAKPKKNSARALMAVMILVPVFGGAAYIMYSQGLFNKNPRLMYYVMIGMSLLLTFSLRKIIKSGKRK